MSRSYKMLSFEYYLDIPKRTMTLQQKDVATVWVDFKWTRKTMNFYLILILSMIAWSLDLQTKDKYFLGLSNSLLKIISGSSYFKGYAICGDEVHL